MYMPFCTSKYMCSVEDGIADERLGLGKRRVGDHGTHISIRAETEVLDAVCKEWN